MRDVRGHVVEREEVHIFYIYDLIYIKIIFKMPPTFFHFVILVLDSTTSSYIIRAANSATTLSTQLHLHQYPPAQMLDGMPINDSLMLGALDQLSCCT